MKSNHANNFDGLRLIGALMVVFHHQFALSGLIEPEAYGVTFGAAGVVLFFAVSGYLVTDSWRADPHLLRFAARRLLRVWPGLAFVVVVLTLVVLCLPLQGSQAEAYDKAAWRFLANNLRFNHWEWSFFPRNHHHVLNQPLWTIAYEVQCYFLLALLGTLLVGGKRALVAGTLLAFAGWYIGSGKAGDLLSLGAYFLAGVVMRLYPKHGRAIALAGAAAALWYVGDRRFGLHLLIPPIVISIGVLSWPVLRDAARFGDLSYGIYLWGWPVQQVVVLLLGKQTPVAEQLVISLTFILTLAWISWHLVEKRALRLKPRHPGSGEISAIDDHRGARRPARTLPQQV